MNKPRNRDVISAIFMDFAILCAAGALWLTAMHYACGPLATAAADDKPDGKVAITAELMRVIDGDTFVADVMQVAEEGENFAWNIVAEPRPLAIELQNQRIRVYGVNAYEISDQMGRGLKARNAVAMALADAVEIKLVPRGFDSFGRLLAIVILIDKDGKETVLADWIVKNKHGVVYKPH